MEPVASVQLVRFAYKHLKLLLMIIKLHWELSLPLCSSFMLSTVEVDSFNLFTFVAGIFVAGPAHLVDEIIGSLKLL